MMGFGSFAHGGSSSSSNLSPLAQPFTVDRSLLKPNPNPLVRSAEVPYPYQFEPSVGDWLHLHPPTPRPNPFSSPNSEVDSLHATSLSCGSSYGYYGCHSITSPGTGIPSSKPATTTTIGAFPYGQKSEAATTSLVKANPYYPQYPSAGLHDSSTSVVLNESGCDILSSSSSFAPLDGFYPTDYSQNPSSLGHTAQWSGFWNGLADDEQGGRKDHDGSLFWSEINGAGSSVYQSLPNQGAPAAEGLTAKHVDIFARKTPIGSKGTGWLNNKCSSRVSVLGPASTLQDVPCPQAPSPVSVMKSWNNLSPNTASYERCFTQLDSCTTDPTVSNLPATNSSPVLVFGPSAYDCNSSALKTIPSKYVNSSWQPGAGRAFDNDEESAGYVTSKMKQPRIQLNARGKEVYGNTSMERNDHIFGDSSPVNKDEPSNQKPATDDFLDHLLKPKFELQVNYCKLPDSTVVPGGAKSSDSVEESSETFDQFNPAVDSPCWKGAPASRHSPFGDTEAVTPHLLVKEFDGCNSLNLEGPQLLAINSDDALAVSSRKVQENVVSYEHGSSEDSLLSLLKEPPSFVNFPSTEYRLEDYVKAGSYHSKVNIGKDIQCSDGIQKPSQPRKEFSVLNETKPSPEFKTSHTMQLIHEDNFASAKLPVLEAIVAGSGMGIKETTEEGSSCVPFHAMGHVSSMPSSGDSVLTELAGPFGRASDTKAKYPLPKIDGRFLVNTMHNLSQLLLSSCSNDLEALKEQDQEVLQDIINNLDACLLRKVGSTRPMPQSQFPQSSTYCFRKIIDVQKGSGTGRSQEDKVEAVDVECQHDDQSSHEEEQMHFTVSSKKADKLQDFVSIGDADIKINDDMTQAIEKILKEKFDDGETHPQTILYKNLWLEAEAALCSVKYNTHYARMKIKMEKCEPNQVKDVAENPINVEKQLGPKVSHDLIIDDTPTHEAKKDSVPDLSAQDTIQSGIDRQAKDMEGSVMARFQVLKSRVDNSSVLNKDGQPSNSVGIRAHDGKEETKEDSVSDVSSKDTIQSDIDSQAEEMGASVMARFQILKSRVDNSSFMNKDGQPPNLVGIGAYAGKVETTSSLCPSGVQNVWMKTQPTEVVDLGFAELRNPWPFIRSEDGSSEVKIGPDMQHHRANYNKEKINLDLDVSEQCETMNEFGVSISDEPVVQSYISIMRGCQHPAGGYDSSSDWEHVLKEELTWQN